MTILLFMLLLILAVIILIFFLDWGHKDELELNSNIIGYGKAKGLYIIKMESYYVVAGMRVKSKRKAVKEFLKIVENNGFLPPGMYFKTFKIEDPLRPVQTVKIIKKEDRGEKIEKSLSQSLEISENPTLHVSRQKPELSASGVKDVPFQINRPAGIKRKRR